MYQQPSPALTTWHPAREPWSVPKGHELWHVAIGLVLGAFVTWLLMNTTRELAGIFVFVVVTTLPVTLMLINAVAYFHESDVESKQRHRELEEAHRQAEETRWWLHVANRAATNKRVGLVWTGRRVHGR